MTLKNPRSAILSAAIRFLTAGGLTLGIALAQEAAKPDRDWTLIVTMAAGLLAGIGGGAYERISARGAIGTIPPK